LNATHKIQQAVLVKHLHLAVSYFFAVGNSAHSESDDKHTLLEPYSAVHFVLNGEQLPLTIGDDVQSYSVVVCCGVLFLAFSGLATGADSLSSWTSSNCGCGCTRQGKEKIVSVALWGLGRLEWQHPSEEQQHGKTPQATFFYPSKHLTGNQDQFTSLN